jgi:phosphatidylglycerophosphatase A
MNARKLLLTFFGSGLAPFAPGTVGTAVSMPFGLLIIYYFGASSLTTLVIVLSVISILEINKYEKEGGEHDDKSIVIDETVGVWLTMAITFGGLSLWHNEYVYYVAIILSFLSFRLFDIWKPSTIGYIDRKVKGGLGVVGDDLLAGFAAGVMNLLIFRILNYFQI